MRELLGQALHPPKQDDLVRDGFSPISQRPQPVTSPGEHWVREMIDPYC